MWARVGKVKAGGASGWLCDGTTVALVTKLVWLCRVQTLDDADRTSIEKVILFKIYNVYTESFKQESVRLSRVIVKVNGSISEKCNWDCAYCQGKFKEI